MFSKHFARVASVGIIAAALVGASALTAQAAEPVPTVGSDGPLFVQDAGTGVTFAPGSSLAFNAEVVGSPIAANFDENNFGPSYITGPADATETATFLSPRGSERTPSAWNAFAPGAFADPVAKTILLPTLNLASQINGNAQAVKAAGGNYSVGAVFTKNNGVTVVGAVYMYITVEAGTGNWTFATPSGPVTPPTPTDPTLTATQNLQATTLAAADGALSLVAPTNTTSVIGNPVIDPISKLSTSTGNLGSFSVLDGRIVTHKGWTVTTSVTDFVKQDDSATTIDKKQLGIAPVAASGTTLSSLVTLAPAQVAGSAVNPAPFAEAATTAAVAKTDLDAGLTFVAPGDKPAGTYTSTLTITLASK